MLLRTNSGTVSKISPWQLPSTSLLIHYSLIILSFDTEISEPTTSVNEPHINIQIKHTRNPPKCRKLFVVSFDAKKKKGKRCRVYGPGTSDAFLVSSCSFVAGTKYTLTQTSSSVVHCTGPHVLMSMTAFCHMTILLFRVVTPRSLAGINQRFGENMLSSSAGSKHLLTRLHGVTT